MFIAISYVFKLCYIKKKIRLQYKIIYIFIVYSKYIFQSYYVFIVLLYLDQLGFSPFIFSYYKCKTCILIRFSSTYYTVLSI